MKGKTLAHYQVTDQIGAGGMGEVYRARDTKLGRDVALKILPQDFAGDADRLSRFDREAKVLASLNHPHIASIYGLEQANSVRFLVLELVEGEDLSQRISRGPIPIDETLSLCGQVAEALEVAHEQGVVHRDLKPANIKVAPDGTVKVLDFGLAKALDFESTSGNLSHSPTVLASSPTLQGVILGTAAYMSPEQARGKTVDKRADVFAFGAVMFEMLTGNQLFTGETVSDTLAAVLRAEPDWNSLPSQTPAVIRRLLRRCLDKDPRRRLRDIGEARIVIEDVQRGAADVPADTVAAPLARRRSPVPIAAASAILLAAIAATATWVLKPASSDHPVRKFTIAVHTGDGAAPEYPVISPLGDMVAYTAGGQLFVQQLDQLDPREVTSTGTVDKVFWSPDGSTIGYLGTNVIWKVPAHGGNPVKVFDTPRGFTGGRGLTWGPNDRIVFGYGNSGLYEISALGGEPKVFLELHPEAESDFHEPEFLPGGRGLLFVTHRVTGSADTIELLADGGREVLAQYPGQRVGDPVYSPSGHILFHRTAPNSGIWALPFSLASLEVTGEAFLVASDGRYPSVTSDGTLVYLRGAQEESRQLVAVNRKGEIESTIGDPAIGFADPTVSPDGTRLAVSTLAEGNDDVDVWIYDLVRGGRMRFTFTTGFDLGPAWLPDGKRLAFYKMAKDSIYVKSADGTGVDVPVAKGRGPDFTPDGKTVVYHIQGGETQTDIWCRDLDGGDPHPFIATNAREIGPVVSPDGRYLAYESDESGTPEIYLTRFPSGDGKWQVSTGGGSWPQWSQSGKKIFYRRQGEIWEVAVNTASSPELGQPHMVFDGSKFGIAGGFGTYAAIGDGERFICARNIEQKEETVNISLTVVQNWFAEFGDRK